MKTNEDSVMPQYVLNTLLQVLQSNMIHTIDYSPCLFSKYIVINVKKCTLLRDCKHTLKTDMEEKKLWNEVVILVFLALFLFS